LLCLAAAVWLWPAPFLVPLAEFLIDADTPRRADCTFVLGGDPRGQRILKAGELYQKGLTGKVFVSGPVGQYDATEDELAIAFARRRGMQNVPFVGWKNDGLSTEYEAQFAYPKLKAEGCRSVIVVTSDFHTRRAGILMRRYWPGLDVIMAAAPTADFDAQRWWTNRVYKKTMFLEWSKTFAQWLGL
jgi:uncharacterized SAM-binding protein YcdF (DUF218 family)